MRPYPPLATLYVAANLRAAGHEVAVFDAMLAADETHFEATLRQHQPDAVVLYEDNFNFLSKMCLTRMSDAALAMIAAARSHGARVIASGSDVADRPELYLAAGADAVAVGEGDHTVAEWVAWLGSNPPEGSAPDHIDGLVMTSRVGIPVPASGANGIGTVVPTEVANPVGTPVALLRTDRRRNERHPDTFSHPARDLVDIEAYRRAWTGRHGYFSLNMVSTRGCPFHCNWCAKPIWGQRYAMRSPLDVATELAAVKTEIGPDHIWFADDIFGLRPAWVVEFAAAVAERDAAIPFTIQSRCDLMTDDSVRALGQAGCAEVWLGAESGSQSVLDAMDKGITVDQIRTARERLGAAGIRACFFVQLGYPGETWDDLARTRELIRDTLPDDIGVSVSYPLPGTRFHQMVASELGAKTNWESSGDLEMMFAGTYTSPFYRQMHLALHDDLDLHRRKAGLAGCPHPLLPVVGLDEQEARVAAEWAKVDELERTCRNAHPTVLVRAEPAPAAPDLSLPYN